MSTDGELPDYLLSYQSLQQHIRGQLSGLSTAKKGDLFARFSQRLIPQTEVGSDFSFPELRTKKSRDGGVDLIAKGKGEKALLYIQAKLYVDRAETIDSVISKFQSFTTSTSQGQLPLPIEDAPRVEFLLITLSALKGILRQYNKKGFASKTFYQELVDNNRIHFIDGEDILRVLKIAYSKVNRIPTDLKLNFDAPYIQKDNVFVGVMSSDEIKGLYKQFGDALFFENVRDFLGIQTGVEKIGRTTPNLEIIKTVTHEPQKLLSRNNGIVFGADEVLQSDTKQLILKNGSVVNGCQTTMCIVEYSTEPSFVLVKVVQTSDSWDITKSANYQTSVPDIDLELARYLRPQLVKRAATNLSVQVKDMEMSAFQIIDEIYDQKVAYSETRLLYIGIFSRTPTNVFAANYTELMPDLIRMVYENSDAYEDEIFETLFLLQGLSRENLEKARKIFSHPSYAGLYERLYNEDSLSYRTLISILAICGATNINIAERQSDMQQEFNRMRDFLSKSQAILKSTPERFSKYHILAIKLWMQEVLTDEDDAKVRRDMYISSKRLDFTNMFRKLCMEADLASYDLDEN